MTKCYECKNYKAKRAIIRDTRKNQFTAYSKTEYVKL